MSRDASQPVELRPPADGPRLPILDRRDEIERAIAQNGEFVELVHDAASVANKNYGDAARLEFGERGAQRLPDKAVRSGHQYCVAGIHLNCPEQRES